MFHATEICIPNDSQNIRRYARRVVRIVRDSITKFLKETLALCMHPNKVYLQTIASGVEFLGWVHFPSFRALRKSTEERARYHVLNNPSAQTLASYVGILKYGDTHGLQKELKNIAYFCQ